MEGLRGGGGGGGGGLGYAVSGKPASTSAGDMRNEKVRRGTRVGGGAREGGGGGGGGRKGVCCDGRS